MKFNHENCIKDGQGKCRCYQRGYQAGKPMGFEEGWKSALGAIRKPNGHIFYCLVCQEPLNSDTRGGRHMACINKQVNWHG